MKHIFYITVLFLFFSITNLNAQTSAINFTLSSETVNALGHDTAISSTITKTENSLVWTQNTDDNTDTTSFTITGTSGNWDQSTSLGSVTYTMDIEGYQSELTLIGQESGISAILRFIITETQEEQYTFNIETISYQ